VKLNAFAMDEARMEAFAAALERARPAVVQGYVSALDLFAGHLLARARRLPAPRVLRSAAETLAPAQRERIEQAFGAPVRDVYGSRESAALAAQCAHGGFHVLAHAKVLEIVDEHGAPQPPGVPGRVLVTDLSNRAMGLIRYENGDVAAWDPSPAPCACGSAYPRLARVHGRTSDFFTLPSGERIHGEWFTHLFYGREDVLQFQVRQTAPASIEVLTRGPADEVALAPLLARLRERVGADVAVAWRRVESIPPSPSGKHRFTVSLVPWGGGAR
jgi:phenylacetate-CoA ligase